MFVRKIVKQNNSVNELPSNVILSAIMVTIILVMFDYYLYNTTA